jgi:predicted outer membrane repeat protein
LENKVSFPIKKKRNFSPSTDLKDLIETEDFPNYGAKIKNFERHQSDSSFNAAGDFITTSSTTIYVSSLSGNDKNNGSKEFPVKTLEHAVFLLQTESGGLGGTLICFPGSHEIQKDLTFSNIQAFSYKLGQAFIIPSSKETYLFLQNQTSLQGFVLLLQVRIEQGNISLTDCKFINNTANHGGATVYVSEGGIATLNNLSFNNNNATNGGAVYIVQGGIATFNNCFFYNNTVNQRGAAVYVDQGGTTTFNNCVFSNNFALSNGGGVYVDQGIITFDNCIFKNNYARYGGRGGAAVYVK